MHGISRTYQSRQHKDSQVCIKVDFYWRLKYPNYILSKGVLSKGISQGVPWTFGLEETPKMKLTTNAKHTAVSRRA